MFESSLLLSTSYLEFTIELTVNSLKSIAYFTLVSDISETLALIYTYTFSVLFTKGIQSFNCEC